jgi:hypothetical protein
MRQYLFKNIYMKQWAVGLMSNNEKRNILDQHKSQYNGYRTMQPQVSNTQPLYIQDFANDKGGITVTNKGDVKPYLNFGINEQVTKKSSCSECGGVMSEGECSECGWKGSETKEGNAFTGALADAKKNHEKEFEVGGKKFDVKEIMQQVKDLENVEDLNLSDKFDYTEEEMYEDDAIDADALQSLTGQEAPHMSDDMAPDGMDDDSDNDRKMMADGEMYETNQGNPYDNKERAYTFKSRGPKDSGDAYSIKADDMDLDDEEVQKPFDFASNGAMREFDQMESAWSDDEPINLDDEDDNELEIDFDEFDPRDKSWEEISAHTGNDEFSYLDEDIREGVSKQKNRIVEMMNRMKGYN